MKREYYSAKINEFLLTKPDEILGILAHNSEFADMQTQKEAWRAEIDILRKALMGIEGSIYFEYSIPRMGKRIDAVVIIKSVIFVLEFKIGESHFTRAAKDQVYDYALDLKYFHETSHNISIAPILIATKANPTYQNSKPIPSKDKVFSPILCNSVELNDIFRQVLTDLNEQYIESDKWIKGRYSPTPSIIEVALALYKGHSVEEISRSDASAQNLIQTTNTISEIIDKARGKKQKAICFITGVPGAGKTLVGLNIATKHMAAEKGNKSVYLSGNAPLVSILQEALARDKIKIDKEINPSNKITKIEARKGVKTFIQIIHHYRDAYLEDLTPPYDHVAIFDEAQRAWDIAQTTNFMSRKKGIPNFNISEPEFLISCLNRHQDWAVIVCLVGGGQEINTGEAGISEWIESLKRSYSDWHIYISSKLSDSEYGAGKILEEIKTRQNVYFRDELHLGVSMRSFRAENVSLLVKQILDFEIDSARKTLNKVKDNYPIVITRDINKAKEWLKGQARGSERYGIIVSSQAERLKPHAIDVKSPMNPIHWFLDGKEDVRSSYYLEDVATEFHVQGLELDWACVTWDADFRYTPNGWEHRSFCGHKWNQIKKDERKNYQKNAYRVLMTRARQGMVIVVPPGSKEDHTRKPEYYNPTYKYLKEIGFAEI